MALELKLSTEKAREQLAAIERSLAQLEQAFARLSKSKSPTSAIDKLTAFKGIEASAISSIDRLASSLSRINSSTSALSNLSRGLNSLARVRVDSIATNMERITAALAKLHVPPSVSKLAADLNRISAASQNAAKGVSQVGRALNTIKAPPGLATSARSIERLNASAGTAAGGLRAFAGASSFANSALAGFGIVLGGIGFARFIEGTFNAVTAVDAFKNAVAATQGVDAVAGEWEFVNKTADSLKINLEAAAKSYGKFAAASRLAGVSTEDTHKIFTSMSEAARVLKLNGQQVENSFKALEQMFSKTTVGAEELRQQLGDALPGSTQLMAEAVEQAVDKLMSMMKAGEIVAADALPKFADILHEKFGKQVPAALKTAQAAMTNFQNAFFRISEAFGRGLFGEDFQASLDGLATALNDPAIISGINVWGQTISSVVSTVTQALTFVVKNFDLVKYAALALVGVKLAPILAGWAGAFASLAGPMTTVVRNTYAMATAVAALGGASGFGVAVRAAFLAAATGARVFMASLGPLGLALAGIMIFMPQIISAFQDTYVRAKSLAEAVVLVFDKFTWLKDIIASLQESFTAFISWVQEAASSVPLLSDAIGVLWREIEFLVNPIGKTLEILDQLLRSIAGLPPPVYAAADASKKLAEAEGAAGNAAKAADQAITGMGAAASSIAGDLNQSANAADKAADSYNRAASAAARLSTNPRNLPAAGRLNKYGEEIISEGPGGGYNRRTRSQLFSGGGISHKGTGRSASVPMSAFIGAPHFAGGGVIGSNGIPAVLHPNEAVVPLAGGGTIPVQMMSGGQGSLLLLKPLQEIVDINRQTKTEVARVWEAVTVQTQLMVGKFNMVTDGLDRIDSSIHSGVNVLKSTLNSGLSSVSASVGSASTAAVNAAVASAISAFGGGNRSHLNTTGLDQPRSSLFGISGPNSAIASSGRVPSAPRIYDEPRKDELWKDLGEDDHGEEGFRFHIPTTGTYTLGQFASGSPNASKDAKGGFLAMLHPDEAVIPLPDGRSVPVSIESDILNRMADFIDDNGNRMMSRIEAPTYVEGGDIKVEVHMVINTRDADSFRASRDQVARELQTEIDRAIRNLGKRSDIDDPTKRMT